MKSFRQHLLIYERTMDADMVDAATRLYSTGQELEKLAVDYISGLKQGKVPSKGEWSAALARARSNEYHIMYDGAFFATDVYSPKKQYLFVNATSLISQA